MMDVANIILILLLGFMFLLCFVVVWFDNRIRRINKELAKFENLPKNFTTLEKVGRHFRKAKNPTLVPSSIPTKRARTIPKVVSNKSGDTYEFASNNIEKLEVVGITSPNTISKPVIKKVVKDDDFKEILFDTSIGGDL